MTTPRENLLSLYRRTGYEHAPVQLELCPSLWKQYRERAGRTPMEEYFDYPEGFAQATVPGLPIKERAPVDWSRFYPEGLKGATTFDDFGIAHEPGSEASAHMTRMRHPMAAFDSLEQMQSYPFPEFDPGAIGPIRKAVEDAHDKGKAAVGNMACTIWETSWYIRGMPELMMDMSMAPMKAAFLLNKITDLAVVRAVGFARGGVDLLLLGDDVGMQSSIMMSRGMYQEWLKPRLKRVIDAAKREKPDVLIFYHTCGYVTPLIDDLIEAGVEILNPVQPECMDFNEIHEEYGDRLSFNGTIGTQTTMPFGTPEEVREAVFRNLEIAGERGGLLCCPTHVLGPEAPWVNIEAYVTACKEFGDRKHKG